MVFGVQGGATYGSPPAGLNGVTYRGLTQPVNTLTDFQVEYNGLLLGKGTQFRIPIGQINFLDLAPVKTMETQRIWADGSFAGPDFADVLFPQMDLKVIGGGSLTQFQANLVMLRNTTTIQPVGLPLWFKVPGFPVMGILARVNKRNIPIDEGWLRAGYAICPLQFRAPDPAWQSVPRILSLAASGATVSGLVFPMFNVASGTYVVPGVADFGASGVSSSSGQLWNSGNTPAWPLVTIPGPITGPFTVQIAGGYVTYSGALQASDTLVIDYSTGLATLNGTADRTTLLTSRQFMPVPALSTANVFFTAPSGTCTVTTADIWR